MEGSCPARRPRPGVVVLHRLRPAHRQARVVTAHRQRAGLTTTTTRPSASVATAPRTSARSAAWSGSPTPTEPMRSSDPVRAGQGQTFEPGWACCDLPGSHQGTTRSATGTPTGSCAELRRWPRHLERHHQPSQERLPLPPPAPARPRRPRRWCASTTSFPCSCPCHPWRHIRAMRCDSPVTNPMVRLSRGLTANSQARSQRCCGPRRHTGTHGNLHDPRRRLSATSPRRRRRGQHRRAPPDGTALRGLGDQPCPHRSHRRRQPPRTSRPTRSCST